jgi:hypothetical protein
MFTLWLRLPPCVDFQSSHVYSQHAWFLTDYHAGLGVVVIALVDSRLFQVPEWTGNYYKRTKHSFNSPSVREAELPDFNSPLLREAELPEKTDTNLRTKDTIYYHQMPPYQMMKQQHLVTMCVLVNKSTTIFAHMVLEL